MSTFTTEEMRFLIHSATSDGDSLDAIEREMIEPAALSDDDKSGLWLYAWSDAGLRRGKPSPAARESLLVGD